MEGNKENKDQTTSPMYRVLVLINQPSVVRGFEQYGVYHSNLPPRVRCAYRLRKISENHDTLPTNTIHRI